MFSSNQRKCSAVILGLVAGIMATGAIASPGSGTTPTNFVTSNFDSDVQVNNDRVKFQTKGATDVRVQKLVFAPGGYTGFHHHPGLVIVAVESGTLTLMSTSCGTKSYGPGSVFVEGDDHAHQAMSEGGATVYVTYVVPSANPPVFRIEDPLPFCAQGF